MAGLAKVGGKYHGWRMEDGGWRRQLREGGMGKNTIPLGRQLAKELNLRGEPLHRPLLAPQCSHSGGRASVAQLKEFSFLSGAVMAVPRNTLGLQRPSRSKWPGCGTSHAEYANRYTKQMKYKRGKGEGGEGRIKSI